MSPSDDVLLIDQSANLHQSARQNSKTIGLCFLVAILEGYDLQAIGVVAPLMIPDLGLTAAEAGWSFSAAVIGLAVGAVAGGWASDRMGRKPVLIVAVLLFGVFTLATALAVDFFTLFSARLLTGLGFGAAMPNLIALAAEASSKRSITTSVAVMFGGLPLGGAGAALLSQYLLADADWRTLFYIGGTFPLLLVPALYFWLHETRRVQESDSPISDERAASSAGAVQILFGPGRSAMTLCLWAAFALTLLQLYLLMNWLPSIVVAKGLPRETAALAAFWFNIVSIAGAFLAGWASDRYGPRWPMTVVYVFMAAAMVMFATVETNTGVLIAACVAGVTVIGAQFTLYGLAPKLYSIEDRGFGVGSAVAFGRAGSIAGPLFAGLLLSFGHAPDKVLLMTIPLILLGGLAVFLLTFVARDALQPSRLN